MKAEKPETWDVALPPPESRRWIWLVVALGLAAAAGVGWYVYRRAHSLDAVVASAGRLTLEVDKGENFRVIDRQGGLEVWYRVTLEKAPDGAVVPLSCEWIDPHGNIYHKNNFETHPITHPGWETHARCRFRPDAIVGPWRVRMHLQGRLLHQTTFEVRDGAGKKE